MKFFLLPTAAALVIPNLIQLQDTFSLVKSLTDKEDPVTPGYDALPLINSTELQALITSADLEAGAEHLYHIATGSMFQFGHPTRVIGSPGHWKTLKWITDTLDEYPDYYNYTKQEFKALDGKVFNHSLTVNFEEIISQPFQLTPPVHAFGSDLVIPKNFGCDPLDYEGLVVNKTVALIKRGECSFGNKSSIAGALGAKAVLIYDESAKTIISGTLGAPTNTTVGALGITNAAAQRLIALKDLGAPISINIFIAAYVGFIKTSNIIADTIYGDHDNVVALGAHSDSVAAGPGINDDGSGTISLLTVAKQLTNFKINNAVRFAWWAAEEEGLLGSNYYVSNLTAEENSQIRLFMDYDMMASPNYEYQIYDGSNSINPNGSEELKNLYIDFYESKGLNWTLIPFDGRSDYVGFIENGIPAGGVAAGAEGLNTENGEVLDKCYHLLCDDLTNIAWDAFLINTQLIAHSVATYAESLEGFPEREIVAEAQNYPYQADYLVY